MTSRGQPAKAMVGVSGAVRPLPPRMDRRYLALALVLTVSAVLPAAVRGEPRDTGGPQRFHIPSQPLGFALEAYARIAGLEVLYDGGLEDGLRSAPVEGVYTPAEALRLLLDGTGLVAEFPDTAFFMLRHRPPDPPPRAAVGGTRAKEIYYGHIQARLKQAFCVGGGPPSGRIAAQLWITPEGRVANEVWLTSSGQARLDQANSERLRNLAFGPPPPGLRQPVTILVTASGAQAECAPVRPRERR